MKTGRGWTGRAGWSSSGLVYRAGLWKLFGRDIAGFVLRTNHPTSQKRDMRHPHFRSIWEIAHQCEGGASISTQ